MEPRQDDSDWLRAFQGQPQVRRPAPRPVVRRGRRESYGSQLFGVWILIIAGSAVAVGAGLHGGAAVVVAFGLVMVMAGAVPTLGRSISSTELRHTLIGAIAAIVILGTLAIVVKAGYDHNHPATTVPVQGCVNGCIPVHLP